MNVSNSYNQVLLPEVGFLRPIYDEGMLKLIRDGKALPFQIEELISLGAYKIAIEFSEFAQKFTECLSEPLKKRVVLIDKDRKCENLAINFIAPIFEEFNVENIGIFEVIFKDNLPEEIKSAITSIFFNLHRFILGIQYKIEVDIDINHFMKSTSYLRSCARSNYSRSHLSYLEGILNTYQQTSLNLVQFKSNADIHFIDAFNELLLDDQYLEYSKSCRKIGKPLEANNALENSKKIIRKVIEKDKFKQIYFISNTFLSIVFSRTMPEVESIESMVIDSYLPPIINLKPSIKKARTQYLQTIKE